MGLRYLEDKWDNKIAQKLDEAETLRYRSNLLGSDLRLTNFGGGNTSSKVKEKDPVSGDEVEVLWVKGSGGDLGSIQRDGFARLYLEKFLMLKNKYRGFEYEDEMVDFYPLCVFGTGGRPASIDTPLHGLLPFKHVDHLHPDWAIALAAAANGQKKMEQFNKEFNRNLIWLPWQRPGYFLGILLEKAIQENPDADGLILASHGTFTWGNTQYECYRNSINIIDELGQFVEAHYENNNDKLFGGNRYKTRTDRKIIASEIIPFIRGRVGKIQSLIGHYSDLSEVLRFVNSSLGEELAYVGTSCPDHFVRTKVRPLFVKWDTNKENIKSLKEAVEKGLIQYRKDYLAYYETFREEDSPAIRDTNPTVVLIPGVGMISFGKTKKEARITGEFYVNAIHVMEGATSMENGKMENNVNKELVVHNYVALPPKEAFRIEYWALEEAKLKQQPPEKEMSRKIAVVIGGGSGIGREFCTKLVQEGAHVVVADKDKTSANQTDKALQNQFGPEVSIAAKIDITDRRSVKNVLKATVMFYGGVDILVNTAAIFLLPDRGSGFKDETWDQILKINVSGNNIIVEEFATLIDLQNSKGTILLTSSAHAVVPKIGSEPYDVSKAAVNHLIREYSIRYAPTIRINGVSPATVVEGSLMLPRERVVASLKKYGIIFDENDTTDNLRNKLALFYAQRTLTFQPVRPKDVVEAGYFLISPRTESITGHIIPVDGGLIEAFLQ